ncbi:alpha/beta fold hydrolase [Halorubrum sp. HHNYT27]|uniref:alpha/beta fold hydrolase n=1 Tax=Halorubrum sp. HHNYT27 TaxID=3402275 RepID=UPI003EBCD2AA
MADQLDRCTKAGTSYLTGGEGPTLLFLHGIPGSALTWEVVAARLQEQYWVIVPDLRGFGQSDPPGDDYYMEGQARAIRELLDALDVTDCGLVTHDFGGPVGLTMMRLFPDLEIRELVLSDTNVFTDTYVPPPLRLAKIPLVNTVFFQLMVGNRFGLRMLYRGAVKEKETAPWSNFQQHLTPSGMAMTRRIFQRSLADLEENYEAIERMLPDIQNRTLILWGDSDPFFSTAVGERMRAAIADAELIVFDETGHFVPEERPMDVAAAILTFYSPEQSEP